jgi:phenylacetic acid degradation operon negative regulatory protein
VVFGAEESLSAPVKGFGCRPLEGQRGAFGGRRLLSESWPLERTADAYQKFMKTFEPLRGWIGRGEQLADADAFTARILLIHHYRRVVLRDPLLPTALLPVDWPGRAARTLCGEIYRALLPGSEQWLDRHASNESGALPKAGAELARRFG